MKEDRELGWKELGREVVFEKFGRRVEKVLFQLPDGRVGDFYIQGGGDPVGVLPITKDGQVVLVRQFRPGPSKIFLELPGGMSNPGEPPEIAMERELLEETGYRGNVQLVTRAYDDAYSMVYRYCFVATECEKMSDPMPKGAEFLEAVLVSLDEFRALLRSGNMTDVEVGYLGLDYLNLL